MRFSRRAAAGLIAGLVLAAMLSPVLSPARHPAVRPLPESIQAAVRQALARGQTEMVIDLTVPLERGLQAALAAVEAAGGRVLMASEKTGYLQAVVPPAAVYDLWAAGADTLGTDTAVGSTPQAAAGAPVTAGRAAQTFPLNSEAMEVGEFVAATGASGRGVLIAVIDTGADPSHPDLLQTPDGLSKVVDWQDFTGEGTVMVTPVTPGDEAVETRRGTYRTGSIRSQSGRMLFGLLGEVFLGFDLDRSGQSADEFGILAVDTVIQGVYDTVYIDTNRDGSFADEAPLGVYRQSRSFTLLGRPVQGEGRTAVVVTNIDSAGGRVTVGFDAHGHGTHIAGIAAGSGPQFRGVAPGAQLMVLKALNSAGTGTWVDLARAITYAAENGADIISISIEGLGSGAWASDAASELVSRVARQFGALVVMAAGNQGPGISSAFSPGDPSLVLTVGGYFSPEMWQRDYDFSLPREGVLLYSGVGPRRDGSLLPQLIAPGSAPAPVPRWRSNTGYQTIAGTSQAVPHVSGAAALLIEAARRQRAASDYRSVKRALEMGARPLDGYLLIEQGYGVVALMRAWEHLRDMRGLPVVRARVGEPPMAGLVIRDGVPGERAMNLSTVAGPPQTVILIPTQPWLKPHKESVNLQAGQDRRIGVTVQVPETPGLYAGLVIADDVATYGPDHFLVTTAIRPHRLTAAGAPLRLSGSAIAGRRARNFVQVPENQTALAFTFRVPRDASGASLGRVEFRVYRPDGQEAFRSQTLGIDSPAGAAAFYTADFPAAGTWEIVALSLPDVVRWGRNGSAFEIEAELRTIEAGPLRFWYPAGAGEVTETLTFTNRWQPFTGNTVTLGLAPGQTAPPYELVTGTGLVNTFEVPSGVALLRVEIANAFPVTDLNLSLLKWSDERVDYLEFARSAQVGTSREVIEVANPPPGFYMVWVDSPTRGARVVYQYRRLLARAGQDLSVADLPRQRALGESWTAPLTIRVPQAAGRYGGYLLLRDTQSNSTLLWLPVEVNVGRPALQGRILSTSLAEGRQGMYTFELREAQSGRPVDTTVLLNGQLFRTRGGLVSVPVQAAPARLQVEAVVDVPEYARYRESFSIRAAVQLPMQPTGVDNWQEMAAWRRKVEAEWLER